MIELPLPQINPMQRMLTTESWWNHGDSNPDSRNAIAPCCRYHYDPKWLKHTDLNRDENFQRVPCCRYIMLQ